MHRIHLLILSILLLSACTSTPSAEARAAGEALNEYFASLNSGDYARAAELYGGEFAALAEMNPEVDPGDHASLLEQACTINGFVCLRVKSSALSAHPSTDEYIFKVSFEGENGNVYERLPCCGGTTPGEVARSEFEYRVVKGEDGVYRVMELPLMQP